MGDNSTVIHNTEIVHLGFSFSQLTHQLPICHDKVSLERLTDLNCHVKGDWYEILEHLEVPDKVLSWLNISHGCDGYEWVLTVRVFPLCMHVLIKLHTLVGDESAQETLQYENGKGHIVQQLLNLALFDFAACLRVHHGPRIEPRIHDQANAKLGVSENGPR